MQVVYLKDLWVGSMNVFYVDKHPVKAAEQMCDKHIVKMILESAQLLCTCHRVQDGTEYYDKNNSYKRTSN